MKGQHPMVEGPISPFNATLSCDSHWPCHQPLWPRTVILRTSNSLFIYLSKVKIGLNPKFWKSTSIYPMNDTWSIERKGFC